MSAVNVLIVDAVTGAEDHYHVDDNDYFILTTGTCEVTNTQVYPTKGTHVITVKGQRAGAPKAAAPSAAS